MIVADYANHRIVECKQGATGRGKGQGNRSDRMNVPTDLIFDKETDSLIIICDRNNRRVIRWSRQSCTRSGETITDNIDCWGLARDSSMSLTGKSMK